ncbi:CAAX prenyl protease-related protein [Caldimonas tepidiphila]|uniref:CAAX prenyl protease-related protein n=1 Tax=Caldimonas tepidiphila TaxID=2315841 RepID=UPI000E5A73D7|nr:CAAX prenyl protease-related protein [Caldimonas tepidiphila]
MPLPSDRASAARLSSFERPAVARVLPFALFMLLLALRGAVDDAGLDGRWIYGVAVLVVGAALVFFRRDYVELARGSGPTLAEAAAALGVGLAVFALWVRLVEPWMVLGEPSASFVPLDAAGAVIWPLVALRLAGAALVVPLMEELFWRAFLMRWIEDRDFRRVDARRVGAKALLLSTFVFVLAHTQWLAAAIAGLAYAGLYRWSGKLWVAVIAHAVTNAALGAYVLLTGQWRFW